ncbi:MAG: hypothetical protein ACFB6R_08320 [Alphaproteobacteria bacterium]
MRTAIAISALLHAGVLALGVVALPLRNTPPVDVPPVLNVDYVTISDETNIEPLIGQPADPAEAVAAPKPQGPARPAARPPARPQVRRAPPAPARRPSVSAESKPAPEPKPPSDVEPSPPAPAPEPSPAVVAEAPPEPAIPSVSQPEPEPAPKPIEALPEDPEPAPEPAPLPEPEKRVVEPQPDPAPADAQTPASPPRQAPKALARPIAPTQATPPREPAPADDFFTQTAALLDKHPDADKERVFHRRAPSLEGEAADRSRAAAGQQTGLTVNETDAIKAQLKRCWSPPTGAPNAQELIVTLRVNFNPDGSVAGVPRVVSSWHSQSDGYMRAATDRAVRAVLQCQPFQLPVERYKSWRRVDLEFDPRFLLGH